MRRQQKQQISKHVCAANFFPAVSCLAVSASPAAQMFCVGGETDDTMTLQSEDYL